MNIKKILPPALSSHFQTPRCHPTWARGAWVSYAASSHHRFELLWINFV